jgi:hypothetical protein
VEKIDYRPSRERELLDRAEPLDSDEQQWVLKVSADQTIAGARLQGPAPRAPGADHRRRLSLERYRANGQERDPHAPSAASNCCGRSTRTRARAADPRPGLPEDGHESRTWQAGIGTRGDRAFGEYGLRMAYHDLNDNAEGFPRRADRNPADEAAPVRRQPLAIAATGPGHHPLPDPAQRAAATLVMASHWRPGARTGQA